MENERIPQIIYKMIADTSIDPTIIYCQFTGAPMGTLGISETNDLFDSLDQTASNDEIIDELYVRTIASMRPSPAWNKLCLESVERLRLVNPQRVMAYLIGRYYQSRDKAYRVSTRDLTDILQDGYNRIITYRQLAVADTSLESFKSLMTSLLLIDTQFNLSIVDSIGLPANPSDLGTSDESLTKLSEAVFDSYTKMVEKKAKLEKAARLHESYLAQGGNRLTRHAAVKSFNETRPKSIATVAKSKRQEAENLVANMLAQIMDGDEAFAPIKVSPTIPAKPLGGLKLKPIPAKAV